MLSVPRVSPWRSLQFLLAKPELQVAVAFSCGYKSLFVLGLLGQFLGLQNNPFSRTWYFVDDEEVISFRLHMFVCFCLYAEHQRLNPPPTFHLISQVQSCKLGSQRRYPILPRPRGGWET